MKKSKIRVIKKKDLAKGSKEVSPARRSKQEAARVMVSNVSNWVNEFQKRKRVETKKALENILPKSQQTDAA